MQATAKCLIDPFIISENKAQFKEAWDAITPFTDLIYRAFEVQEFASDAGRPINDREIMAEVYTVIYQTGILMEDFKNWDECPNVEKRGRTSRHTSRIYSRRCGEGISRQKSRHDSTGQKRC